VSTADLVIAALAADPDGRFGVARGQAAEALARGVGGFVLTGGEQDAVRALAKELQQRSRTPLLVGAELERGAGQQFAGATGLPPLAAVAWLNDAEALRRAARLTAREARTMGVNWNVAPVVDLDVAAGGPALGTRSLGAEPAAVARLAAEWITACQAEGVLACAKHFPGAGRVAGDAGGAVPVVAADRDTLYASDLVPFRAAIDANVASMMTAHAAYPALDPSGAPATLSRELLQWTLRQQLRYDNLVVADFASLPADAGDPCDAAVRAIAAGCDVIVAPADPAAVAAALDRALADRRLDPDRVRQSQRRRLKWAQWAAPPNDWRRPTAADQAWGAQLADRVVHAVRGEPTWGPGPVEIVIVDDDPTRAAPAAHGPPLVEVLRTAGIEARVVGEPSPAGGPLLVALFSDARAAYAPATRERLRAVCAAGASAGRAVTVLQFGHPGRVDEIPGDAVVVAAWSGDRAMQQAAARWVSLRARG
jgi:beta-glucosidase-like glycosyl hydrolase